MRNWKEFGRNWSLFNEDTILTFAWNDRGTPQKTLNKT
jgi:hypothetical protein